MSELFEGLRAAGEVAKAAPSWLDNALSTLDKFNLLPMPELRKKNALDKAALQRQLDEQNHAHKRAMDLADAQTRAAIACMEAAPQLALDAAEKALSEGASLQQAYQNNLPSAMRATSSLYKEALEGQHSKERVALYALKEAAENPEEIVGEGETSKTFEARFWEYAKGIRDEEVMQQWGKLIANEIRQPGSFSLRTLDILRSISSDDSRCFSIFSKYIVNNMFVFMGHAKEINASHYELQLLENIGLIMTNKVAPINDFPFIQNKHFELHFKIESTTEMRQDIFALTPEGAELYKIVNLTREDSLEGILHAQKKMANLWKITSKIVPRT